MPFGLRAAAAASACVFDGYVATRTMNGATRATEMTVPIFFAAASASAAVAYGPACTANCAFEVAVTTNDLPRVTVFCRYLR